MIQLKDVIHLYFGCECEFAITVPGQDPNFEREKIGTRTLFNYTAGLGQVKPILRKLQDMTETEKLQLAAFQKVWSTDNVLPTIKLGHLIQMHYSEKSIHITKWLLEKKFDLFDLIPSGQAIDKAALS